MNITFRPIDQWPQAPTKNRKFSQFKASYQNTLDLLARELEHLGTRQVVIQLDLREDEIRLDGIPRAAAKPASPGVIISFESRHGPLRYMTDAFQDWKSNLRAIALGLEALRKIDRYGITKRGEQYTGWKQLEASSEELTSREQALDVLQEAAGVPLDRRQRTLPEGALKPLVRDALFKSHPDRGGSEEAFVRVQRAKELLLGSEE